MSRLLDQSHCKLVSLAYCSQTSDQPRVGVHGSPGRQVELQEWRKPIQLSSWWPWCSQNILLHRQLRHHLEKCKLFSFYFSLHILLTPTAVMGFLLHSITDLVIISVMKIKKFSYKCVQVYMCTRKTNIFSLSFTPIHWDK